MREPTYIELCEKIKAEVLPNIEGYRRNLAPLLRECSVCGQLRACPSSYEGKYICYSCSFLAAELDAYGRVPESGSEGTCRMCNRKGRLFRVDDMNLCSTCMTTQVEKRLTLRF